MKKLTSRQEESILRIVKSDLGVLGRGSSRVVFDMPFEAYRYADLDEEKEYVVKIPYCSSGLNQTQNEIYTFEEYKTTEYEHYLAEIAAIGEFIIIMEKIEDCSEYFDNADDYDLFDEQDIVAFVNEWGDECSAIREDAVPLLAFLQDQKGTSDSGQIGYNGDGRLKIYDYGFDVYGDNLIGDIVGFSVTNDMQLITFLDSLIQVFWAVEDSEWNTRANKNWRQELLDGIIAENVEIFSKNYKYFNSNHYSMRKAVKEIADKDVEKTARDEYYAYLCEQYDEEAAKVKLDEESELPF